MSCTVCSACADHSVEVADVADKNAECHLQVQGECGHQCQPDDFGAVPGSLEVEPAAQGSRPQAGTLQRKQGMPPALATYAVTTVYLSTCCCIGNNVTIS